MDLILLAPLWLWGGLSMDVRRPMRKADNFATFICRLTRNFGNLNFLKP